MKGETGKQGEAGEEGLMVRQQRYFQSLAWSR